MKGAWFFLSIRRMAAKSEPIISRCVRQPQVRLRVSGKSRRLCACVREGDTMMFRKALAALVVLVLVGYAGTALAQQKVRMQPAVPSASIYFELLKRYSDRVDKMSNGRVKIEVLPDGAIVPAFEILDAVDKGIVEAGYAWTHYWSGKHPAAGMFSNPRGGAGGGRGRGS